MVTTIIEPESVSSTSPYKSDDPGQGNWITTDQYLAVLPSAFERAVSFFERNKEEIEKAFSGKFIAIYGNSILDSDTDFSELARRVYEQCGYTSIYMPFVGHKPVMHFRSPRLSNRRRNESQS